LALKSSRKKGMPTAPAGLLSGRYNQSLIENAEELDGRPLDRAAAIPNAPTRWVELTIENGQVQ
jgi:hypothetical protein